MANKFKFRFHRKSKKKEISEGSSHRIEMKWILNALITHITHMTD